jgi:Na+/phosphate symporter
MIVYVVAIHLVAAVVHIIRTVGNKKDGNPGWKIDFAQFFGNLAQVVLCLVFIGHVEIPVYIYCIGEIYGSILKIISSCKKTAIVYVQ